MSAPDDQILSTSSQGPSGTGPSRHAPLTGRRWRSRIFLILLFASMLGGGLFLAWWVRHKVTDALDEERFLAHTETLTAFAMSPDGNILATGDGSGTVFLARLDQEGQRTELAGATRVLYLVFSPDSRTLLVTRRGEDSSAAEVVAYDLTTSKVREKTTWKHPILARPACSPDGKLVALAGGLPVNVPLIPFVEESSREPSQELLLWDLETGSTQSLSRGPGGAFEDVCFASDGKTLAAWSYTVRGYPYRFGDPIGGLQRWDVPTGKPLSTTLAGAEGPQVFSPDGRWFAVVEPGDFQLWDARTGQERGRLQGNLGGLERGDFSPDGKWLVTIRYWVNARYPRDLVSLDSQVQLWDAQTGRERAVLLSANGSEAGLAFAPNGNSLAVSSTHGLELWDLQRLERRGAIAWKVPPRGPKDSPEVGKIRMSFSADSQTLFAEAGGSFRCWETATGRELSGARPPASVTLAWRPPVQGVSNPRRAVSAGAKWEGPPLNPGELRDAWNAISRMNPQVRNDIASGNSAAGD
jgi:WD40 repeat protein